MKTLNLNATPVQTITFVFGQDLATVTQNQLIELATKVKESIAHGKSTNEGLDSTVIGSQVKELETKLSSLVELIDSDHKFTEKATINPHFDLDLPVTEQQTKVYGVWVSDLEQDQIVTAIKTLKEKVKSLKELNEGINSEKISKDIEKVESNVKMLVKELDSLPEKKEQK